MANVPATWTDPKTGTEVREGDRWQDREPIYPRGPLRIVEVLGPVIDRVRSRERIRIAIKTHDYRWRGRDINGHLIHVSAAAFVKRFVLVSRAPDAVPADPNALKPCPFCGSSDLGMHDYGDDRTVSCSQCDCEGPRTDGEHETNESEEAEARRLWNTRAEPARG